MTVTPGLLEDHYAQPRNRGTLPPPARSHTARNPLCGDEIVLYAALSADGAIQDLRFEARACSFVIASASLLTEAAIGKSAGDITSLAEAVEADIRGRSTTIAVGQFAALRAVRMYPTRITCALLPLTSLQSLLTSA